MNQIFKQTAGGNNMLPGFFHGYALHFAQRKFSQG